MSQSDIAEAIQGAIAADVDRWVRSIAPWVDSFAKAGEEAMETFLRVSHEFEVVGNIFDTLGGKLSVFGADGIALTQAFVDASGTLENALANVQGYIDNFYSESEKQELRVKQIQAGVGGGIIPEDKDAYKAKIADLTAKAWWW